MPKYPTPKHNTPIGAGCQDYDSGLRILARMIARHHLRVNSSKRRQLDNKETDDGNENKSLPDA